MQQTSQHKPTNLEAKAILCNRRLLFSNNSFPTPVHSDPSCSFNFGSGWVGYRRGKWVVSSTEWFRSQLGPFEFFEWIWAMCNKLLIGSNSISNQSWDVGSLSLGGEFFSVEGIGWARQSPSSGLVFMFSFLGINRDLQQEFEFILSLLIFR